MVDTGAAPNLIKKRNVHPETPISSQETLLLSGITKGKVKTLGSINIIFMGYPLTFHIVPDNFPIAQEGILGSDFLRNTSRIDFQEKRIIWHGEIIPFVLRETIVVPSRSSTTLCLRVTNSDISEGYIPRLSVGQGVYFGDAVVTNRDGKIYTRIINTNNSDFQVEIPAIELQEIEKISNRPSDIHNSNNYNNKVSDRSSSNLDTNSYNKENFTRLSDEKIKINSSGSKFKTNSNDSQTILCTTVNTKIDERVPAIRELLRLDYLNKEESEHVDVLIRKYNDLFRLPDEKLACTTKMSHRITTTDNLPVNTKQYRFPPIHKEKINN